MDIGSSSVARAIINLVLGHITSLVVDMAVLIEVLYLLSSNLYMFVFEIVIVEVELIIVLLNEVHTCS